MRRERACGNCHDSHCEPCGLEGGDNQVEKQLEINWQYFGMKGNPFLNNRRTWFRRHSKLTCASTLLGDIHHKIEMAMPTG